MASILTSKSPALLFPLVMFVSTKGRCTGSEVWTCCVPEAKKYGSFSRIANCCNCFPQCNPLEQLQQFRFCENESYFFAQSLRLTGVDSDRNVIKSMMKYGRTASTTDVHWVWNPVILLSTISSLLLFQSMCTPLSSRVVTT